MRIKCNGEAHRNPWIDNCPVCMPRWGWIVTIDPKPSKLAGLRVTRLNKYTGSWLSLYNAEEAGLDSSDGKWTTVCEAHGTICNHKTFDIARLHLSSANWCEECQSIAEGK